MTSPGELCQFAIKVITMAMAPLTGGLFQSRSKAPCRFPPHARPSRDQRRAAERITANLMRNKAEQNRRDAAKAASAAATQAEPARQNAVL